jgi:acyl-coenzyme A thioesterase 13
MEEIQETKALEALRDYIGKEFIISPSPFTVWLKPIVVEAERGKIVFRYVIRKEMTNPMGILHGGVTAAIIDDIFGAVMYSLDEDHFYTTLNNVVDYFAPAFEAQQIIAEAHVIKKGSQIVNAQCEVWNEGRTRMIARGTSNLIKTKIRKKNA